MQRPAVLKAKSTIKHGGFMIIYQFSDWKQFKHPEVIKRYNYIAAYHLFHI